MSVVEVAAADPVAGARATMKLYIAPDSPSSDRALANLRRTFEAVPEASTPTLEVIDVYEFPLAALQEGVIVTPTLLIEHLGRRTTMFGDLSDVQLISTILTKPFT